MKTTTTTPVTTTYVVMQTSLGGEPFRRRISEHSTITEAKQAKATLMEQDSSDGYSIIRERYQADTFIGSTVVG